jgi:hypothetical protein
VQPKRELEAGTTMIEARNGVALHQEITTTSSHSAEKAEKKYVFRASTYPLILLNLCSTVSL